MDASMQKIKPCTGSGHSEAGVYEREKPIAGVMSHAGRVVPGKQEISSGVGGHSEAGVYRREDAHFPGAIPQVIGDKLGK